MAKKNKLPRYEKRTHFNSKSDFLIYINGYLSYVRKYQDRLSTPTRIYHLLRMNKLVRLAKKRGWYNA